MESTGGTMESTYADFHSNWSQWQLLDSILPTGGFAHSSGLEAAVQMGVISDSQQLKKYVTHILQNTASLILPFVHQSTMSPTLETWLKLDKILDATLTNDVGRRASVAQGSALMRVAAAVFPELPSLKQMRDAALSCGTVAFHHGPVFGVVCGLLGWNVGVCQRSYMFVTMRDVISSATRLNLVGPLGAAVLQHELAFLAEDLVGKYMNKPVEEACQTVPLLDIFQGCHAFLFSRLFCS